MLRQLASWSSLSLVSTFHPLSTVSPNWYFWSKPAVLLPTRPSAHMLLNGLQWSPHSSAWISGTHENHHTAFIHMSIRLPIAHVYLLQWSNQTHRFLRIISFPASGPCWVCQPKPTTEYRPWQSSEVQASHPMAPRLCDKTQQGMWLCLFKGEFGPSYLLLDFLYPDKSLVRIRY